jgi:hypothetical protein
MADHRVAARHSNRCRWRLHVFSAQVSEMGRWNMSKLACKRFTTGLGIIFMLGGVVAAYVKALQLRVGKQEKDLMNLCTLFDGLSGGF